MMTNHRRLLSSAALVAAGALALAGCSADAGGSDQAGGDAESRQVSIMLNWTPNAHHAGIFYAEQNGLYEAQGIDLEVIEPNLDAGVETAVVQGAVDFGVAVAESLLPARQAGADAVAIGTVLPVNDSALMGLSTSGLSDDPASLTDKRYGGYGGALETEIISELVTCSGGDANEVEFVDIGNVDYLAGLEQDRFDVTWVFEGWDGLRAQSLNDDVVTINFSDHEDCIPNWYTPILVTSGEMLEEDPELVEAFMAATAEGYDAIAADPAAGAAALLEAAPEMDEELAQASVDYYAPLYGTEQGFGTMDAEVWGRFAEFLVQAEMIDDSSALEGAWTNDYLPQGS